MIYYHHFLFIVLLIISLLFYSCNNTQSRLNKQDINEQVLNPKTIVDPQNRRDTVFWGYILGQSTKKITNNLIDERKMDVEHKVNLTIRKGGVSQVIYVYGYPFDLYIADKKYNAFLSLFDTDGERIDFRSDAKLMSLQIYICDTEKDPIIEALKEEYGEPNLPPEEGYESFVPKEDMDAFWNISNKAVYLATLGNFMVLVYEDILAIMDKRKAENAAIEKEKEFNQEQSKKTQL